MPTSTTAFSYASAALAFLLFSLLLLTGWRQRPHRRWLLAASLLTVLWGVVMACATVVPWAAWVLHGAEWLRNAAWRGWWGKAAPRKCCCGAAPLMRKKRCESAWCSK